MDIRLRYAERGAGPVLIMLHGNGESCLYFKRQIDYFSRSFRVIAVDTRGHGKSPRGKAPFTIKQFARDLYCFMNEMNIDKACILGYSDGGNIALRFAADHPERVERLAVCGANLYPNGIKATCRIPMMISYALFSFFSLITNRAKRRAELLRLMVKEPDMTPEELYSIEVPTMVLAGDRDVIKESHTRLIAGALPDSRLCILPGPHSLPERSWEAFDRVVEDFMAQQ